MGQLFSQPESGGDRSQEDSSSEEGASGKMDDEENPF